MQRVIMPKMGDAMEEGTLLEWLKKDGEKVQEGEAIGTIQTDKATLELPAPASGNLAGMLIGGGDTVPVGAPIAAILAEGEALPTDWKASGNANAAPAETPQKNAPDKPATAASEPAAQPQAASQTQAAPERLKASPLARRIAAEGGLDLASVAGSGPGGRIVERDVRGALERGVPSLPSVGREDRRVPLTKLRQIIAERTSHAKREVPHFYVTVAVDCERLMDLREMFEQEDSGKVSVNDFVVMACARALAEMPQANATIEGNQYVQHGAIHIGIALAVEDGLLVPVLKNVQELHLRDVAQRAKALLEKGRDGKLTPDEMSGSTFSISNMGMLDVDSFSAIINEPNAAIVAVGTIRRTVVATDDDELQVRRRMNLTGSFDHRVLDGALGARFMNLVKANLENPTRLL